MLTYLFALKISCNVQHFLVGVYPFQMEVAQQSTRKMLLLIWSKEPAIAESVVEVSLFVLLY
jgi:hypothetical protein